MEEDFKYDVFLSHSSHDNPTVRAVAERLRSDGLRVWLDDWEPDGSVVIIRLRLYNPLRP